MCSINGPRTLDNTLTHFDACSVCQRTRPGLPSPVCSLAVSVFSDADFLASLGLPLHAVSALLVPPLLRWAPVGCRTSVASEYSLSFDFAELRFCYRGLHSSREAAADARSSAGESGRCAKWYATAHARRRRKESRGAHGQRRGAALEGRLESAGVISRILREWRVNRASHPHGVLFGWSCAAYRAQFLFLCRAREVWLGRLLPCNSAAHEE